MSIHNTEHTPADGMCCLQAALPPTIAVAASRGGYLSAEEPADTIVRTRTYDLYITYDQVRVLINKLNVKLTRMQQTACDGPRQPYIKLY
jgi:hypothetical protein